LHITVEIETTGPYVNELITNIHIQTRVCNNGIFAGKLTVFKLDEQIA
jgi:hypothetical protein